ncbi:uncharacterized protein BKCO1_19000148 [Diplodia corticola]|uniref:Uncharacterized protein n=1 Tax=Diplodia corticola TaxID=236234 RepID=A0A1J9S591_9PEZI|nr:uncharacterized protein BKCO1_19000148 [Diplodia corticola]OJD35116.1 hypothetical protein BKCO1_19000148 [Diplodia corticola]
MDSTTTTTNPQSAMAHRTFTQSSASTRASVEPVSPSANSQTFCFNNTKPIPRSVPLAEQNFFGAIKEKIRERSRSRSRTPRSRERSPMPPTRLPSSGSPSASPVRSHAVRRVDSSSTTSSTWSPAPSKRQSTDSSYSYYYGRHTNQWLFGGFSVRETVKDAYNHMRGESH